MSEVSELNLVSGFDWMFRLMVQQLNESETMRSLLMGENLTLCRGSNLFSLQHVTFSAFRWRAWTCRTASSCPSGVLMNAAPCWFWPTTRCWWKVRWSAVPPTLCPSTTAPPLRAAWASSSCTIRVSLHTCTHTEECAPTRFMPGLIYGHAHIHKQRMWGLSLELFALCIRANSIIRNLLIESLCTLIESVVWISWLELWLIGSQLIRRLRTRKLVCKVCLCMFLWVFLCQHITGTTRTGKKEASECYDPPVNHAI